MAATGKNKDIIINDSLEKKKWPILTKCTVCDVGSQIAVNSWICEDLLNT